MDLIQRLLVPDPTKRLNTAQILGHEWITGRKGLKDGTLPGNDWEYGNFVRQKYQTEVNETSEHNKSEFWNN